jgi:hypothetical protein
MKGWPSGHFRFKTGLCPVPLFYEGNKEDFFWGFWSVCADAVTREMLIEKEYSWTLGIDGSGNRSPQIDLKEIQRPYSVIPGIN